MADEKTGPDSLWWYLTGASSDGGTQADPDASLGNYRSSTVVAAMSASVTNPIANVTIDYVSCENGEGNGSLTASGTSELKWTAPGGSQGVGVTIANGETKIVQDGGDPNKYVRVSRTSATALSGTATVTITDPKNNVIGFDNVSSAEATAGDDEYRCLCIKNESGNTVASVKAYVATLGTQRVSAAGQLASSGSGTITISSGTFDDWPTAGFARIVTSGASLREIVYYTSRTSTALTVPADGRGMLGTSAAAGASDDTLDAVPGIRLAKDAPSSQSAGSFEDETGTGEGTSPGLTFNSSIDATNGEDLGDLAAGNIYGIWVHRQVPAGATNLPNVLQHIKLQFEAA